MDIPSYLLGKKAGGGGGSATLIEKNITANDTYNASDDNADGYSKVVVNVPTGGAVTEKDVNFYDYDGTLVDSYTKTEFLALTEMPEAPTHTGFTFQEWNWSLENAKTYVTSYNEVDIGAVYVTDDGATRIYFDLDEYLNPYLCFAINGTATVTWGDGTTETITGTSGFNHIFTQHTYATKGSYVITISSAEKIYFKTINGYGNIILSKSTNVSENNYYTDVYAYAKTITKIELGSNIDELQSSIFSGLKIKTINIPKGIPTIPQSCFSSSSIIAAVIPSTATATGGSAFLSCHYLKKVVLPYGFLSIGASCFKTTYNLQKITLPSTMTSIFGNTLQQSTGSYNIIPNGITSLYGSGFDTNYGQEKIILPSNLSSYATRAFSQAYKLKEVTITRTGSTTFNGNDFNSCINLEKVTFPENCSIASFNNTFNSCARLKEINLPNGLVEIGTSAFSNCSALQSLKIPSTVTSIGSNAFQYCYSMKYYDFSSHTTIPTLSETAPFKGIVDECKIIVPDNLYTSWKAATGWSTYAGYIISKSDWDALQS